MGGNQARGHGGGRAERVTKKNVGVKIKRAEEGTYVESDNFILARDITDIKIHVQDSS